VSIQIRAAEPGDVPAVVKLIQELEALQEGWRVFPPRSGLVEDLEARYRASIERGGDLLLVALEGAEIVGTTFAHVITPSAVSDEQAVELSGVIVRPDRRGRGIGRALTREGAAYARARGIRRLTVKVFAQNEDGRKLWEGLGFRPRMIQMTVAAGELVERPE
jgi:ribosomal protein S18 acetylase RimI-like enzyme